MIVTIIAALLILSVLVIIHELGHFLVAKKFGIKVEEFGIGFPPRAWSKKIGETIYSLNWLPIGGFVKLYGEDEAGGGSLKKSNTEIKGDLKRAFFAKPAWQRALVVVAGVGMNFLLAVVIYYVFLSMSSFKTELPKITDHNFVMANAVLRDDKVAIVSVSPGSPADLANIRVPSSVTSVNGEKMNSLKEFIDKINENKGKEVSIGLVDMSSDEEYRVSLTPRINPPKEEGAMGVGLNDISFEYYVLSYETNMQRLLSGFSHSINLTTYNINALGTIISKAISNGDSSDLRKNVSGPIGIVSVVGQVISIPDLRTMIMQTLNLAGLISVTLAFFNVLPIPALDGGRLFFILIEMLTGKKVPAKYEAAIHAAGLFVLLSLIILVSISDVIKLFG